MSQVVSSVTGKPCCGFGCANIQAFIVPRNPTTGDSIPINVEIESPSGSVDLEHNRIGFGNVTIPQCDCVDLIERLNAAGIDGIGEWGHELWVWRDCEPDEPIFAGPIVGISTDERGDLTIFAADRLIWLGEATLRSDLFGQWRVGDAIIELLSQSQAKNDMCIIIDQQAVASSCRQLFEPEFGVSDCRTILDWWLEMADVGLFCFRDARHPTLHRLPRVRLAAFVDHGGYVEREACSDLYERIRNSHPCMCQIVGRGERRRDSFTSLLAPIPGTGRRRFLRLPRPHRRINTDIGP